MKKNKTLLLGAHISIAGGFEKAIERGESIGCTAIQIFTKSNRQWSAKPITKQEIEIFKKKLSGSIIQSVTAHSSYLINVGSLNDTVRAKSIDALTQELIRCEQLGIPLLVLHPGSCGNAPEDECIVRISNGIDQALKDSPGTTKLLLETMAGQGSNIGSSLEQIKKIYELSDQKKRLGVCVDTCHIFAAGYDIRTEKEYKNFWNKFDEIVGRELLHVIHVNDSKKELGSRVDRHEHIGKGALKKGSFELLFNDPSLFDIPKILETPKDDLKQDLENMQTIQTLISPKTREIMNIYVADKLAERGNE